MSHEHRYKQQNMSMKDEIYSVETNANINANAMINFLR